MRSQRELESALGGLAAVFITEPDEPEEQLPVALDNPGILKHFELLVKLYAPPKYNEIDPTVLIAPTFLFFFGLMITDAIYGVMTLLLGIFILRGGGKYYPLYKSCGLLLVLGGVSTIVLGTVTGGWLGNLAVDYLGMTFLNSLVIINPMVDVSNFLLFSIGVGLAAPECRCCGGHYQRISAFKHPRSPEKRVDFFPADRPCFLLF